MLKEGLKIIERVEMKPEEILQRLFYVDISFERLNNKPSDIKEFNKIIADLKNKAKNKSLDEIKKELNNGDLIWFNRLADQNCKILKLNVSDLCIDDYHNRISIGKSRVNRGDKIENISQSMGEDNRIKSLVECYFFEELLYEIPIVVRPYYKLYEVISGNHRAISAFKKGKKEINCLCFCDASDTNLCNTLNFKE